jgi:hypothetical protein
MAITTNETIAALRSSKVQAQLGAAGPKGIAEWRGEICRAARLISAFVGELQAGNPGWKVWRSAAFATAQRVMGWIIALACDG